MVKTKKFNLRCFFLCLFLLSFGSPLQAQQTQQEHQVQQARLTQNVQQEQLQDSIRNKRATSWQFSGQLSGWGQFSPDFSTQAWFGTRYIPQINVEIPLNDTKLIDFEVSANTFVDAGIQSFADITSEGSIKPYRAWTRYSTAKTEVRLGLQKINFGSAQMFRPLMWFDSMDPRDPLQLTDGVWGALLRYYFQDNTNIWFWGLYGNNNRKGWEVVASYKSFPEVGSRVQLPIPKGEGALTYHYRKAETGIYGFEKVPENRFGVDIRLDVTIGLWLESSWTRLNRNIGAFTNQQMITLGADYTFDIGNGVTTTCEQFFYSYSEKGIHPGYSQNFSGMNISYPLTLLDNLSAMVFYDWKEQHFYHFLNWQHQRNNITLHAIGYWNPQQLSMPYQMGSYERFAGKGLQLMVVWHH